MYHPAKKQISFSIVILAASAFTSSFAAITRNTASTCRLELESANRSLSRWAETMESMINESQLPTTIRESVHNEANSILDLIEDFGQGIVTKEPSQLARDLVTIRRRANRMALEVYLSTFDMRWPQNSLQLGVIVERVQQACLDRNSIMVLESATLPLDELVRSLSSKSKKN